MLCVLGGQFVDETMWTYSQIQELFISHYLITGGICSQAKADKAVRGKPPPKKKQSVWVYFSKNILSLSW